MEDEILACIEDKNVKFLYDGRISEFVFPVRREEAHQKRICHIIIRFFIITETPDKEILYLVQKRGKNK